MSVFTKAPYKQSLTRISLVSPTSIAPPPLFFSFYLFFLEIKKNGFSINLIKFNLKKSNVKRPTVIVGIHYIVECNEEPPPLEMSALN